MGFTRPEIIRPPSEWRSYYLPLTFGCSNNSCTFCNFYGSKLQVRDIQDVRKEIDALSLFMLHGIQVPGMPEIIYLVANEWDGQRIFLQDGDAVVYPYPQLVEVLEYLNAKFPRLDRIASYATARDILRRSPEELNRLRGLKLGIFYIGVESGDEDVLRAVHKGVDYAGLVEASRKAKEAGILVSVSVILGLGGVEGSGKHALGTARILTDMDPEYVGALTLSLVPGAPLYQQVKSGEFHPISPFQSLAELKTIVENVRFTGCFFSSMHASNYLAMRGQLPEERDRMLQQLDAVLARRDPSLLRPEFLRGL